jgi:16S rRNA (cytosine967-C5)-methyltransferase
VSRQSNLPPGNTPHRVAAADAVRDGRVRRNALALYERAAADWAQAPSVLARGFRGARELRSHERRFVGEAVYGMIRWRRRLSFAVADEAARPLALYLAWLARELGESQLLDGELRAAGIDPRSLSTVEERLAGLDASARLAIGESYPDWIVQLLVGERDDAAELLRAMNRRAPLSVRANRLRNTREELVELLRAEHVAAHPIALTSDGLTLETHVNAYGLAAFQAGRFELQDAGSQLIAELCAPPPRGLVVDACAGAGGKTLALGALLGNRGRLVAIDVSARKLGELRERARRAGLTNVRALAVDEPAPIEPASSPGKARRGAPHLAPLGSPLAGLPRELVGACDRVLCDAPCSGLGVLRRNPEARWRLSPADLDELPRTQRAILEAYAPLVAVGGRLIYATCTVARVENDGVVDGFLAAHPEYEEAPAREILGGARARAIGDGARLRLLPHVHDSDGFFAAVLRRRR